MVERSYAIGQRLACARDELPIHELIVNEITWSFLDHHTRKVLLAYFLHEGGAQIFFGVISFMSIIRDRVEIKTWVILIHSKGLLTRLTDQPTMGRGVVGIVLMSLCGSFAMLTRLGYTKKKLNVVILTRHSLIFLQG